MAKTTSTALALILALAAPLAAQDTAAPAEGATTEAAPADTLALGQEVGGDGPGSNYTAATFEAWEQRCVRTESGVDPCQRQKEASQHQ